MTEIEKKLMELNGNTEATYGALVNRFIRERYTIAEELAVQRQRFEKPLEFSKYNTYAEECKARAKKEIYGG